MHPQCAVTLASSARPGAASKAASYEHADPSGFRDSAVSRAVDVGLALSGQVAPLAGAMSNLDAKAWSTICSTRGNLSKGTVEHESHHWRNVELE